MKRLIRVIVFLIAFLAISLSVAKFLQQNSEPLQLQFFQWRTKEANAGVVAGLCFLAGFLFSFFVCLGAVISKSLEAGRFKRENASLQKLLQNKAADHSISSNI